MLFQLLSYIVPTLLLIGLGLSVGGFQERRHLKSLAAREAAANDFIITNLKAITQPDTVRVASLVGGQVVIATDYFKTFATRLRNLVGGEMKAAESMMTRARREAVLRMIEDARQIGAKEIWNVRFAFCSISQMSRNRNAMSVELYAYGTAIVRD